MQYGDGRLAMHVDDLRRTDRVTHVRLMNEAVAWGLGRDRATQVVTEMLDGLPTAMERAREETDGVPDELVRLVEEQAERLRTSF